MTQIDARICQHRKSKVKINGECGRDTVFREQNTFIFLAAARLTKTQVNECK